MKTGDRAWPNPPMRGQGLTDEELLDLMKGPVPGGEDAQCAASPLQPGDVERYLWWAAGNAQRQKPGDINWASIVRSLAFRVLLLQTAPKILGNDPVTAHDLTANRYLDAIGRAQRAEAELRLIKSMIAGNSPKDLAVLGLQRIPPAPLRGDATPSLSGEAFEIASGGRGYDAAPKIVVDDPIASGIRHDAARVEGAPPIDHMAEKLFQLLQDGCGVATDEARVLAANLREAAHVEQRFREHHGYVRGRSYLAAVGRAHTLEAELALAKQDARPLNPHVAHRFRVGEPQEVRLTLSHDQLGWIARNGGHRTTSDAGVPVRIELHGSPDRPDRPIDKAVEADFAAVPGWTSPVPRSRTASIDAGAMDGRGLARLLTDDPA